MPPKGIPAAMRRELDARFQELNGILEQRMQRLEALIALVQAASDTAEAAPAANICASSGRACTGRTATGTGARSAASSDSYFGIGRRTYI